MATFNISTDTNIDECTSKTGGDVYNISEGATLTIDQDSRYGLNTSTSASIERMVINNTGGTVLIDGRYIRLIPFTDGYGTLTLGDTITCGDASGVAIGIYTSLTAAPSDSGESGWIKIKQWNGEPFPDGYFTAGDFEFNVSGPDVAGWIEILTDEGTTAEPGLMVTVPYLGSLEMRGEWFELGDTDGYAEQTFQIPTNGELCYVPGIFIEETDGYFTFYANAATSTGQATDIRAKICWIATTGVVTLGHDGSNPAGYVPPEGLRVVVPNIITSHCAAGDRTTNVIPNATLLQRFQMNAEYSGIYGTYIIDKANLAWYCGFDSPNIVNITNSGIYDCLKINRVTSLIIDTVGVGCSANLNVYGTYLFGCYNGTINNMHVWKVASTAGTTNLFIRGCNLQFTNVMSGFLSNPGGVYVRTINITDCCDCGFSNITSISGGISIFSSRDINISNIHFVNSISGTTTSSNGQSVILIESFSENITFDGLDFMGLTNVHPYTALYSCSQHTNNIVIKNIGSYDSPLDLGSANVSRYAINMIGAPNLSFNSKIKTLYTTNSNVYFGERYDIEKIRLWSSGDDYDMAARPVGINPDWRGIKCAGTLSTTDRSFGTHFWDAHTSTTAGRLILLMHPPSTETASRVTITGTGYFNGYNGLYLKTIGDTATWEQHYYMIGHTGFSGAPVMAGGTIDNYLVEYQIDLRDGNGWSAWEEATQVNLEANNPSIDATVGFKMKVRFTTTTGNGDAITSIYFGTTSTTTTQAYQYKTYETNVTIHVIDATTLQDVPDASVQMVAGNGGEYTPGTVIGTGTTDSNGECVIVLPQDAAQEITGIVCKGTSSRSTFEETITPGTDTTIMAAMCGIYNAGMIGSCF